MFGGAHYVCWEGPICMLGGACLYVGRGLFVCWAWPVLVCSILGNSVSFVITVLCLNVGGILLEHKRA